MTGTAELPLEAFAELKVGDRVQIEHRVTAGVKRWPTKTNGVVVEIKRQRHGLHFRRNMDDRVASDVVLLRSDDGELTSVALDEFTFVRRA